MNERKLLIDCKGSKRRECTKKKCQPIHFTNVWIQQKHCMLNFALLSKLCDRVSLCVSVSVCESCVSCVCVYVGQNSELEIDLCALPPLHTTSRPLSRYVALTFISDVRAFLRLPHKYISVACFLLHPSGYICGKWDRAWGGETEGMRIEFRFRLPTESK